MWTDPDSLRWLFLDLNSYFASVEQQLTPSLRGRPVAVAPVMTDSTCAIAASYEAKAFGIRTGTPIWEAKQLCPDLRVVPARHDIYVRFHERIIAAVDNVVSVTRVESIDELGCRLPEAFRSREAALALGRRVKMAILDAAGPCLRCSVGIAPNRFLAKVATELQKPDGLVAVGLAELPGPLLKLVPRDLPGIGPNMERRLNRAGVFDMATLWALPAREVRRIWHGIAGEMFWHALHGVDLPPRATRRRTIGHSRVLDPALREPEAARLVARRIAVKAATRLRRINYVAGHLALSVRLENGSRRGGDFHLGETEDSLAILHGFDRLWQDAVAVGRPQRIKKVSIVLYDLAPRAQSTMDLFAAPPKPKLAPPKLTPPTISMPLQAVEDQRAMLSVALDGLNKRFGRDTVTFGALASRPVAGQPSDGQPSNAQRLDHMGAKVAFTRIPDLAEFDE